MFFSSFFILRFLVVFSDFGWILGSPGDSENKKKLKINFEARSERDWTCGTILVMILERFCRFLLDFGIANQAKINNKSIQKHDKNKIRFWIDFCWLLGGFWGGFGAQVEAKLRPSWNQNPLKTDAEKKMNTRWLEGIIER